MRLALLEQDVPPPNGPAQRALEARDLVTERPQLVYPIYNHKYYDGYIVVL